MKNSFDSLEYEDLEWENISTSVKNNDSILETKSSEIILLSYNINRMAMELSTLKKEIQAYRLANQEQYRITNLHYALSNASINEFAYYKTIDDIYLKRGKGLSSFLVKEIIQVFLQGHGYKIDGYYLDDKNERTIKESIPFYSTQREVMNLIKKGGSNKALEAARLDFVENISNQIQILTGSYPKVDISGREIVIWEN